MPPSRSLPRARTAALAATSTVVAGLTLTTAPVAHADVSSKIASFTYSQNWSNGALITANDNWSGVSGVQGYRGDDLTAAVGADPQTITADGSTTPTNVLANASVTASNGGLLEIDGQSVAMQGSGTADAPTLVFRLDLSGRSGATFSFDAQDLDASADNTNQQLAVQYRVGATGAYTNLPAGYVADATSGPNLATMLTHRDVPLPAATNGRSDVYVRVVATNAPGNDELVGIDDIAITTGSASSALAATSPGAQTSTVGQATTPFSLQASGGTTPYRWTVSGQPTGIDVAADGTVSGTPTAAGSFSTTVTVSDASTPAATDSSTFAWTVSPSDAVVPIADIQGTGDTSPKAGQSVTTQGVVTAAYPTGGLNGFYLQTPGPDTLNASDAIFVYGGGAGFTTYPAVGDSVRVRGAVSEFNGLTEITATQATVSQVASLGDVTAKAVVPGTDCALPGGACLDGAALDAAREAVEGEVFQPTAAWTATDVYDGGPEYNNGSNSSSNVGEIGLAANSDLPLVAPTELYDVQTEAGSIANRVTYNDAHRIILDDGSSTNYTTTTGQPFPWMTATYAPRVGAAVTFPAPVVLTWGFNTWRLQPSTQVVGAPTATQPQFEQTRADDLAPEDVGGDLKLATFNVLNYFATTGEEYVSSGLGTCTYYSDRSGTRITTNSCGGGSGPRGAANAVNLQRQRDKIVVAINASTADIVSLEELENSVKFDKDRDFAISALVDALNADAGAGTWAFVPSPAASELPAVADQDVIRTGFIYQPATVALVGASDVLADESTGTDTFANAREPLAQAFKKVGAPNGSAFAVIVNHFKSKGSGTDDGTGQGNSNPDRVAQAESLVSFADEFQTARNTTRTFLVGDFNAYSHEDPIQALEDGGYTNVDSTFDPDEETYNFDGQIGSLDHVLANDAALADVHAADVWAINGYESVYYEYSRYNYNATNLYAANPFRSSDHSPEIVGINVSATKTATTTTADDVTVTEGDDVQVDVTVAAASGSATPTGTVTLTQDGETIGTGTLTAGAVTLDADTTDLATGSYPVTATYGGDDDFEGSTDSLTLTVESTVKQVQLLAANDFHGRIQRDDSSAAAGAAILAGAVKQLRGENPDTVFAAAGDLIGASTFESFIAHDKPTIDALNEAGLEVSAVGNHEFDQGYDDLVDRVMAPYDADDNPYGGAQWEYLGANVRFKDSGDPALDGTWIKDLDGVQVGFVGAVTEHLPELVSPGGISDIEVTDIVEATNEAADDLKAEGADIVVLLVHEGAPSTSCADMPLDPTSDFGSIVTGVDDNVDAIVSGHTHLAYNCSFPVAGWSGRAVTERPVVSAGQYGANLNQLVFDVDTATGDVTSKTQQILALKGPDPDGSGPGVPPGRYPADPTTASIVSAAVTKADVLGAEELGQIAAPFKRGYLANGTTENRGAESTAGNLVADAQRWATRSTTTGAAQIAFMNPGGLRADLLGNAPGTGDPGRPLTYKQAATVQPFANTLVNMTLTGAQVKQVLEQQWQPAGASRPFLKLGLSQGFTYTYSANASPGNHITQMWLNGSPINAGATYSVTVNSFLASGGDNFTTFAGGTGKRDTGQTDLQGMVDYLAEFANVDEGDAPLAVDYSQRAVGVSFPAGAPASYRVGEHVRFAVSSFSMTGATDVKDAAVRVERDGVELGTFPLDNAAQTALPGLDEVGKASVDVVVPDGATGTMTLTLVGTTTGTSVTVPVAVAKRAANLTTIDASVAWGQEALVRVQVGGGVATPAGVVRILDETTSLGSVRIGASGGGTVKLPARSLLPGAHTLRAVYSGDDVYDSAEQSVVVTVAKATTTLSAADVSLRYGKSRVVTVTMGGVGQKLRPTASIVVSVDGIELATAPATNGVAQVSLPAGSLTVGAHTLTVSYPGDDQIDAASTTLVATVRKNTSTTVVKAAPARPRVGNPTTVSVRVDGADGVAANGQVRLTVQDGDTVDVDLVDGKVVANLPGWATTGDKTVTVDYLGSQLLEASAKTIVIVVRPRL